MQRWEPRKAVSSSERRDWETPDLTRSPTNRSRPVLRPHSWIWQIPIIHSACLTHNLNMKNFRICGLNFVNSGVPMYKYCPTKMQTAHWRLIVRKHSYWVVYSFSLRSGDVDDTARLQKSCVLNSGPIRLKFQDYLGFDVTLLAPCFMLVSWLGLLCGPGDWGDFQQTIQRYIPKDRALYKRISFLLCDHISN